MIYRNKTKNKFSVIANQIVQSDTIGFFERGILIYLLSKPDDWETRTTELMKNGKCGRDKILKALGRLESAGYLKRYRTRDNSGQYIWNTDICEFPNKTPLPEKPDTDKPTQAEPTQENTYVNKELIQPNTETQITNTENILPEPEVVKMSPEEEIAYAGFEYWRKITGREGKVCEFTGARKGTMIARIRAGATLNDIKLAVCGILANHWHKERNMNEISYICRNGETFERFLNLAIRLNLNPDETNEPSPEWTATEITDAFASERI